MTGSSNISADISSKIETFLNRNAIRSLRISGGEGIIPGIEISDINLQFIDEGEKADYPVHFKLQSECATIFRYIETISTAPTFSLTATKEGKQVESSEIDAQLSAFLEVIRGRVKSALKEQTVQNIRYVGNTFILNNSTKFKVLSDEGEGRLNIELLTKDKPFDAMLTASGLLDGLYLGSIKLIEN